MITLNQPKTIATSQTFEIACILIDFSKGTIIVTTLVKSEDGDIIDTLTDFYYGDDANNYWNSFNSKLFAYQQMVKKNDIPVEVKNIDETLSA